MFRRFLSVCLLVVCPATGRAQTSAHTDGWVVLSVSDYHTLRSQAFPSDRPPEALPLDATISHVDYDLTARDAKATGHATVTIDVLKDGWVSVPLPGGLFISEARLGTTPLPIVHTPTAAAQVLLSRRGRVVVTLDLVVPVTSRAGMEQVVLPASASGLVKASVTLSRPDVDVTATGGVIVDRASAAGTSRVVAHASAGQSLSLSWQRKRDTQRAALPLVLRGAWQQAVGLGDEVAHVAALVTATVVQGTASMLSLKVPAGLTINQVQGAEVADWDVQGPVLRVTLIEPTELGASLLVTGEFRPPAAGSIAVPLLQLTGAERETGSVAVEIVGAGEVSSHTARGLDPADPSDLGELMAGRVSPATVAFRYRPQPQANDRSLELNVARYTPHAVLLATVDEARYRVLLTEDGKALVEARLAVRNNQRSFLGVRLPAGATLWSATIDGRPVRPGKGPQDVLLLPLQKRRAGEDAPALAIHVLYVDDGPSWGAAGERVLDLPAIDVPVQRTGLSVHHSPRFRLALAPGVFRVRNFEPPMSAALGAATGQESKLGAGSSGTKPIAPLEGAAAFGMRFHSERLASEARLRDQQTAANEVRALVDRYQRESRGARSAGVLPVTMAFPEHGPRLSLATELTPEGVAPQALLTFKRTVK